MRLHQVGASQAEVVAFRCDGAPWIWDRLTWVQKRLGLSDKQVSLGLDWCHAVHHVSLALAAVVAEAERKRVFKKLRKWLKAGRWQKVVNELVRLAGEKKLPEGTEVWTEIAYLGRHGEEGHLDYATYRRRRLPVGSGAIESAIRRVINLRLKGASVPSKGDIVLYSASFRSTSPSAAGFLRGRPRGRMLEDMVTEPSLTGT